MTSLPSKHVNLLLGSFLFFMTTSSFAEKLTIEHIYESPSLSGSAPESIKISPNGERVTFRKGKETNFSRYDLWEYQIPSGKTQLLFDADDLSEGDESLSDEEKARRERMRISGSGIMSYEWSADSKALIFPLAGDVFYVELANKKVKKLLDTPEFETDIQLSPKGTYISYIRKQNLFIMNISNGKETAITSDGGGDIKFGMAEFVAQEEMSRMTGYWWSPDEKHIALTKVDEAPVDIITRSEIYADSIKTIEQKYPKAGTNNVSIALAIHNLANNHTSWVNLGENEDIYIARVDWMNNDTLTYQQQTRDQKKLELNAVDIKELTQRSLLVENASTWVNLNDDLTFLDNNKHFIWASERSGFKHLYLYTNEGELVKQLTQGDWVVENITAIDNKAGLIYFQGRKDTPLERHLYSVNIDSTTITRITKPGKFHSVTFSDDASVFVSSFSDVNTPSQVSLFNAKGEMITWLEENKVDSSHPLQPFRTNWVKPSFGSIKTDDGTDLHYKLYTPKKISGKHPAIVYLYGGPHAQVVTNSWGGKRGLLMQHWVDKGYVVFSIDNRGSYNRGKAFEDPIYKSMGSVEVDDQVSGVKFLRTLNYVDVNKVGVYGHSYGGYMTLMAMFKASDYFSAGVSGAPVTDWLLYDTHYTERYMGDPRTDADAYTQSSVFPYAENLKGKLLIYHGMADDNVLFTHSTKLYKHLQDQAITFETMDYPGKKHSIRGKNTGIHLYKTITEFFDRNLQQSLK